jgi:hypothetical protein
MATAEKSDLSESPEMGNTTARQLEDTKGFDKSFFVLSPYRAFVFQRPEG